MCLLELLSNTVSKITRHVGLSIVIKIAQTWYNYVGIYISCFPFNLMANELLYSNGQLLEYL